MMKIISQGGNSILNIIFNINIQYVYLYNILEKIVSKLFLSRSSWCFMSVILAFREGYGAETGGL